MGTGTSGGAEAVVDTGTGAGAETAVGMDAADWARLVDTARGGTVVAVVVCRDTNEPCSGRDVDAPMLPDKDNPGEWSFMNTSSSPSYASSSAKEKSSTPPADPNSGLVRPWAVGVAGRGRTNWLAAASMAAACCACRVVRLDMVTQRGSGMGGQGRHREQGERKRDEGDATIEWGVRWTPCARAHAHRS